MSSRGIGLGLVAALLLLVAGLGVLLYEFLPWPGQEQETGQARQQPATDRMPRLRAERLRELTAGGYIIFLRHAEREHGIPGVELIDLAAHMLEIEPPPDDLRGHCLTETGKHSARVLGELFRRLSIAVSRVYASPICRSVQTAELAFGRVDEEVEVLSFMHQNFGDAEALDYYNRKLRKLMQQSAPDEGNVVMSAHGNMLYPIDIEHDELKELGLLILDRDLEVIGVANPADLASLIYELKMSPQ